MAHVNGTSYSIENCTELLPAARVERFWPRVDQRNDSSAAVALRHQSSRHIGTQDKVISPRTFIPYSRCSDSMSLDELLSGRH